MKIAQLSDLHLSGTIACDTSYHRFLHCLHSALSFCPDFLLLTGDLVHDGNLRGYDWLFDTLQATKLPYGCIAGNHDGTMELNHHLPFDERQFLPTAFDTRLFDCTRLCLDNWQLLLLNTAVPAHIHGHLSDHQLTWLSQTLTQYACPTLIAMHHHPMAVQSAWIDAYRLDNAAQFWQITATHHHVQAVLCGHVHQAHTLHYQQITLYTCPAVARQFKPWADEFTLDDKQTMGFRLITLDKHTHHTQIIRCR